MTTSLQWDLGLTAAASLCVLRRQPREPKKPTQSLKLILLVLLVLRVPTLLNDEGGATHVRSQKSPSEQSNSRWGGLGWVPTYISKWVGGWVGGFPRTHREN